MPVPASKIIRTPLSAVTSIHVVLPPYLIVLGPGDGIEPRTPQNFIFIN
ncbi:hypothetical protein MCHI_001471 [Candidatus Magnetoovum chiemensis]|nr:hypothetical protein MCHI_001471 [Candidatus Magnetoovum chiemensis]